MIEAINEWGLAKGLILGFKRLLRCHPWGTHGYDPIPKRNKSTVVIILHKNVAMLIPVNVQVDGEWSKVDSPIQTTK